MERRMNRRQLLGTAGLAGAYALGAGAVPAKGDEAKKRATPFGVGKPEIFLTTSLDPKAAASDVSPDGRAATIIFGDAKLGDLQIALGEPDAALSAVKLVTFRAKVEAPADRSMIGYRQVLQGFIDKGKNSRVVIIADLAGTTKVIEYPYGQEVKAESYVQAFFSPDVNQTVGTDEVAPLPEFTGTITLLVQTRSPKDRVLAAIDSLDFEALLTGVPNPARKRAAMKKR